MLVAVLFSCNSKKENIEISQSESQNQKQDKPNILLIVVDDQGYADFTPFDNHDETVSTPN